MNPMMAGGMNNGMIGVQSMMQFKMLEMFKFGDPLVDAVVMTILLSIFGALGTALPGKFGQVNNWFNSLILNLYHNWFSKYFESTNKTKTYKFVVEETNMSKKIINTLFPAVYWYVTNKINTEKESPITYSKEEDISLDESGKITNANLNREVPQQKRKDFVYKSQTVDIEMTFWLDKKLETIYGSEQEVKKENTIVNFEFTLDENSNKNAQQIFDDFCNTCMVGYMRSQETNGWKQTIYTNSENKWNEQKSDNYRTMESIILKEGQKERLLKDLADFVDEEQWCKDNGIPWTRGYLLYGQPGTGKTSFIKAVSNHLEKNIYYLMLKDVKSDQHLKELFGSIKYKKGILVIEDIDCTSNVVKDRKRKETDENISEEELDSKDTSDDDNTAKVIGKVVDALAKDKGEKGRKQEESGISLSGLLNSIDGILDTHGRIMFLTSNDPKVLDKALIRPGRVDIKEFFSYSDKFQLNEMYKKFYKEDIPEEDLEDIEIDKVSPAELTEVFRVNKYDRQKAIKQLKEFDRDKIYSQFEQFET